MKGEIVIEQARAWMRLNPKYCRVKAAEMAAHLGVGGKSSGILDDIGTVPERRHNALLDLADCGDFLEDDMVQAMSSERAHAYAHWPGVPADWKAAGTTKLPEDTARRLAQGLDGLAACIAADDDGDAVDDAAGGRHARQVSTGLVYPDGTARFLPGVARAIVSVRNAASSAAGITAHPGTVAMMVDDNIWSGPYRDLTERFAGEQARRPALVVAARRRNGRAGVIYALADWRVKLQYIKVSARRVPCDPPVSAYLIVEGICAHRIVALPPGNAALPLPGPSTRRVDAY